MAYDPLIGAADRKTLGLSPSLDYSGLSFSFLNILLLGMTLASLDAISYHSNQLTFLSSKICRWLCMQGEFQCWCLEKISRHSLHIQLLCLVHQIASHGLSKNIIQLPIPPQTPTILQTRQTKLQHDNTEYQKHLLFTSSFSADEIKFYSTWLKVHKQICKVWTWGQPCLEASCSLCI